MVDVNDNKFNLHLVIHNEPNHFAICNMFQNCNYFWAIQHSVLQIDISSKLDIIVILFKINLS